MGWCSAADLEKRLAAVEGISVDALDLQEYIDRAQTEIASELSGTYGIDTMTAWDSPTPPRIVQLTADLATIMFLKDKMADFTGRVGDSKSTYGFLEKLCTGKVELFDTANVMITRIGRGDSFNSDRLTPKFSVGDEGAGTIGDGTLDDY